MRHNRRIKGIISLKNDYGFVASDESEEDYFVPPDGINQAMDGDLVEISIQVSRGRTVGVVEKVLERKRRIVTGLLDIRRREWVLVTRQATFPIVLEVDRKKFANERVSPGFYATAELIEFPTAHAPGVGRLLKVIGPAGDPSAEISAANAVWGVSGAFPEAVTSAAARIGAAVATSDLEGRWDFRNLDVFTIDPTDARDFDDAISLEISPRDAKCLYRVGIHISDVSHYVPADSTIDIEARRRATSIYLPGEVVPMLPERLSNGICSLVEGEDRLTMSVIVEMDECFTPLAFRHGRSVIRSKRRFTYEEVDEILSRGTGDFAETLLLLRKLAEHRVNERLDRGAVDLELPEEKPVLDIDGRVIEVRTIPRSWSHRLIEELMLMANEYAARTMLASGIGIYRIHEEPLEEKIEEFKRMAGLFGGPARGSFKRILDHFRGKPMQRIIEMNALRSFKEACYSPKNLGHFGLALDAYTHFTSPIRRYPDLVVHRLLKGERVASIPEIARHSSMKEREAMEAEREAVQVRLLEYASTMIGDTAEGYVDSFSRDGVHVQLDGGLRGFIRMQDLGRERFRYDRRSMALIGDRTGRVIRMGCRMSLVLSSVDITARKLYLLPESVKSDAAPLPYGKRKKMNRTKFYRQKAIRRKR